MKKHFSRFASQILTCLLVAVIISSSPTQVQAQAVTVPWVEPCYYEAVVAQREGTPTEVTNTYQVPTVQGARCIIANILSIGTSAVGLVGFVMFLIGSFTYLLSGGNTKGTESSKQTLTFAVVGIVVALSAFILLNVIRAFTGVDRILQFEIPTSDDGLPSAGAGL